MLTLSLLAIVLAATPTPASTQSYTPRNYSCTPGAIPTPHLFGAEILSLTTHETLNRNISAVHSVAQWILSYCSVNITYTHPGWNDTINVEIWLPLDGWNGRFQGIGGGGWAASNGAEALAPAVAAGYAAAGTDGGHTLDINVLPADWVLTSPGNINYFLLQDFAAVALSDMSVLGHAVTESYYHKPPVFSYWVGCSQGGRQGLMLAQRYPNLYDGILAKAPAINVFVLADYWPQQVMNRLGVYPTQCELSAFTQAAVQACDSLDGLVDGVIADGSICHFDAESVVGQKFDCNGKQRVFTEAGAKVVTAAWTGPIDANGRRYWYGLGYDAPLGVIVNTTMSANGTTIGAPVSIATDWIKTFLAKDPEFNIANMTDEEYFSLFHRSGNEYNSIMATSDPDLTAFKTSGGKMITWHGAADPLVFPNGTVNYYERVSTLVPDTQEFYRHFQAPGVWHCQGGPGLQPVGELDALVDWVEKGNAPLGLTTVEMTANGSTVAMRKICAWPKKQRYNKGDPALLENFSCE